MPGSKYFLYVADTGSSCLARRGVTRRKYVQLSTQTTARGFNKMGTQRSWMLNMYDADSVPVRNDVYANFKQQSLSKEASGL